MRAYLEYQDVNIYGTSRYPVLFISARNFFQKAHHFFATFFFKEKRNIEEISKIEMNLCSQSLKHFH